jgi:hypothetical protein
MTPKPQAESAYSKLECRTKKVEAGLNAMRVAGLLGSIALLGVILYLAEHLQ